MQPYSDDYIKYDNGNKITCVLTTYKQSKKNYKAPQ